MIESLPAPFVRSLRGVLLEHQEKFAQRFTLDRYHWRTHEREPRPVSRRTIVRWERVGTGEVWRYRAAWKKAVSDALEKRTWSTLRLIQHHAPILRELGFEVRDPAPTAILNAMSLDEIPWSDILRSQNVTSQACDIV